MYGAGSAQPPLCRCCLSAESRKLRLGKKRSVSRGIIKNKYYFLLVSNSAVATCEPLSALGCREVIEAEQRGPLLPVPEYQHSF